ncbi:XdhC family protein [Aliirhizobium smilacinae]|uniref:XdhC family protein n=1 Tax=Aliirhizobium smilacinae TaxID=1395944 RepID=A0A5C4XFS1_9HYPH|nr:XdhC family protein [Rhizobium smilacinae]TNM62336.1 XdhC family protein [Rhizobium smilacinae]
MTVSTHPSLGNKEHRITFPDRANNFEPDATNGVTAEILPVPTKAFSTDSAVEVLDYAIQAVEAGRLVALCTLVEIRGGSSRSLGAHMAVADDGLYCGYVSGGCTEAVVAAEAMQAISKGHDRFVMLGEGSPFFDIVLPCGGGVTVAVHIMRDIRSIREVMEGLHCRRRTSLSYNPGSQSLSFVSGEADAGWNDEVFLTSYRPAVRILLSGHTLEVDIAAKVARAAGYEVLHYDVAVGEVPGETLIDDDTAVALLQHDLELEIPVLDAALHAHPFYLGALGSSRTHAKRMQRLREFGHSQEAIDRIKAPIGLFGPARDAQSLALSVIADIAACRQAALVRA